jgi:SnoaL-like domain
VTDLQREKALVRRLHEALAAAGPDDVGDVLARFTTPDWHWRGMHPFNEQVGAAAVAEVFWRPLLTAFTRIQRRPDIFIAGLNEIDGFQGRWVVEMGHLMALFDQPWLGIPPTQRIVMLHYAEFNRVEDDRIVETAMFVDIPHLMAQAGRYPFAPQTGAQLVQPGPATHDGLCYAPQDPERSAAALAAIDALVANPRASVLGITETERLHRVWHDDMIWWGPTGIGASYTIERYLRQHAAPFGAALMDGYRFNGHLCRLAEGDFGGYFGWANLTLRNAGGFMGMPAGPGPADMRVVDLYRVADGKLAENWIFIDLLHWCAMQGLDVLGRMAAVEAGGG